MTTYRDVRQQRHVRDIAKAMHGASEPDGGLGRAYGPVSRVIDRLVAAGCPRLLAKSTFLLVLFAIPLGAVTVALRFVQPSMLSRGGWIVEIVVSILILQSLDKSDDRSPINSLIFIPSAIIALSALLYGFYAACMAG